MLTRTGESTLNFVFIDTWHNKKKKKKETENTSDEATRKGFALNWLFSFVINNGKIALLCCIMYYYGDRLIGNENGMRRSKEKKKKINIDKNKTEDDKSVMMVGWR